MNEKLQKALKSSKQGIWIILVLAIVVNAFAIVNSKSILDYAMENWTSLILIIGLITGLVLYGKGKYKQGAQTIQWIGMGQLILSFSGVAIVSVITKNWALNPAALIGTLLGVLIPVILLVEALKVLRLTDDQESSKVIPIIAIAIIVLAIVGQVIVANNTYNKVNNGFSKVDFEQVFDTIILELGYKDDLESLPELTEEEKTKYEKEWNDFVVENRDSYVQTIKTKYPMLSDELVQDYVTQVFKFLKEYGPRIAKNNQEIIDKAENAILKNDLANAKTIATLAWADAKVASMQSGEILSEELFMKKLKERNFDFNQFDVVMTDSAYEIKIKTDSKDETIKSLVEDAIHEYDPKSTISGCGDGEYLYKKVRLPKINIDTNVVKKINADILKLDEDINTSKGGYDLDIDYTYKYVPSKDLLFVKVTKVYAAHCATGTTKYHTYIYDKKSDKVLTFNELLNMYKIDEKTFEECAYDELERYLDNNTENLEDYKERLEESLKNKTFSVQNIDNEYIEVYFPVDLSGFSMKI